MNKIERFKEIVAEMATLYENKNKDYGDSFGKSIKEHGNIAGIVRMEDKFNRLKSLLNSNEKPNYESVSDTLTDLANYAIMMRIELEGKEGTSQKATQFECKVDADLSSLASQIITCPHKSLSEEEAESLNKALNQLMEEATKYFDCHKSIIPFPQRIIKVDEATKHRLICRAKKYMTQLVDSGVIEDFQIAYEA